MDVNSRRLRTRHRDLLRAVGDALRQLREDTGLSQAAVARAAGISPSYLSYLEQGLREPGLETLLRLGEVLGADLSIRYFPTTGPRIRDRHQLAMSEGLLPVVVPTWRADPEARVYRPVRGVIDLVLEHRADPVTVASELQSELRRVEQQIRWAGQKADALAALPDQAGRTVSRLLVLRNTATMREVARAASATLAAVYPARTADAVAALRGEQPWPGAAIAWMQVEGGTATLMERPPRGVPVGR